MILSIKVYATQQFLENAFFLYFSLSLNAIKSINGSEKSREKVNLKIK
jgi:hypothetical protein